ncbi:hypothetical protein PQR39_40960 [Paraburkholderia sediminicola]|uniref:hypothetical protein n=1 Tax=Paraburkholderia sediminicola TaxID=458836 RepID=UPI0038B7FFCC
MKYHRTIPGLERRGDVSSTTTGRVAQPGTRARSLNAQPVCVFSERATVSSKIHLIGNLP